MRLKTWLTHRVVYRRERINETLSSFWAEIISHFPVQGWCEWSWIFVAKRLLVTDGVDNSGESSGYIGVIVSGYSEKHLC